MVKIRLWQNHSEQNGTLENERRNLPVFSPGGQPEKNHGGGEDQRQKNVREIMKELDSLVGLAGVKKLVGEIHAFVEIQRRRQREKLATEPQVLHMVFKGNPGTGKTTVARIIGRLFKEVGVLPKGHLVEVERADLVGEYIGHTAQKTRDQIKKALGGILFIDEAYSLARGGEKDFGREAIDALVKGMEDHKDNLILILAGYRQEMEWFMESNPGLRSRFPIHITFPDYTTTELLAIADLMLKKRQYHLSPGARDELRLILEETRSLHVHSGNARLVRNLIERAIRQQAVRLVRKGQVSREELMTITREDILQAHESSPGI
ncbi:stage V sporulation protein K [Desulfofundulus sp. TPOSR]|uniref:stage V sporulation protein K n=1 Tax=Desulfofundulus sp. TPOSR TaxID=2714340 RepID=UPI0014094803|nr:stage V sporulation protein K [Desulfofundulus sp. TPOSR]NHM25610.1 stage V sporulation protein K [Desulfofundulus sp. TPOSR]